MEEATAIMPSPNLHDGAVKSEPSGSPTSHPSQGFSKEVAPQGVLIGVGVGAAILVLVILATVNRMLKNRNSRGGKRIAYEQWIDWQGVVGSAKTLGNAHKAAQDAAMAARDQHVAELTRAMMLQLEQEQGQGQGRLDPIPAASAAGRGTITGMDMNDVYAGAVVLKEAEGNEAHADVIPAPRKGSAFGFSNPLLDQEVGGGGLKMSDSGTGIVLAPVAGTVAVASPAKNPLFDNVGQSALLLRGHRKLEV